jgi:PRTRC genetic system protein E
MIPVASTAGGLFSQLAPLLAYRALLITVSKLEEGDLLQVNICPRQLQQGENQTLTAPLCVTGTAAELDVELVSQLATFVSSHVGLTTNLAAIEQEVAEAEKAAREAAKKKHKAVGNGGGKSSESASSTAAVSSKPQPEPPKMLSLFDQQMQKTQSEASEAIP